MKRIIPLVVLVCALVAVSGSAAMTLSTFRGAIYDQHRWTNRALENRCRDRMTLDEFTRTPLAAVLRSWRDDRVRWAKAKHHRVQDRISLCSARDLGRELAAKMYGWTGYQWDALDAIVMRESSWNPCRHYPSTTNCGYGPFPYGGGSACGIPQAVPCSKLIGTSRELGEVSAREQIVWMLRYIAGRYGSPAAALANGSTY